MAVRRLADEQPENFAFTAENDNWAHKQIGKYPSGRQASAVIPLLWRAQEQEGWVSEPAIRTVAAMLDMPYIRVLEVATFYTMFHLAPVGRKAHVQVCGTTPCMLRGAQELTEVCRRRIHDEPRHCSPDGGFSWEEVECLGACVNAPMVQIGKDYYEDLTSESFEAILEAIDRGEKPVAGPQIERILSAPVGGLTSLTDEEALREGARARHSYESEVPSDAGDQHSPPDTGAMKQEAVAHPTSTDRSDAEAARSRPTDEPDPKIGLDDTADELAPTSDAKGSPDPDVTGTKRAVMPVDTAAPRSDGSAAGNEPPVVTDPSGSAKTGTESVALPGDASRRDKADAVGDAPPGLEAPREGRPDDLKKIRGIGKVNEKALNDLGIFHYDQIAGWTPAQVRWVGTYLSFPGRIDREQWVEQAAGLAGPDQSGSTDAEEAGR